MQKNNGFTLIELMVTIAVLAIVGSIAVPSFQSLTYKNELRTEINGFLDVLNKVKYRAKTQGKRTDLQLNSSSNDPDTIVWHLRNASEVSVNDQGDDVITFLPNGQVESVQNDFPVCVEFTHAKSSQKIAISINKIGIISNQKKC